MDDLVAQLITEINTRLREAGHPVSIRRIKKSLYIRTNFDGRRIMHSTRLKATPQNCFEAEKLALRVVMGVDALPKDKKAQYWIAKFEKDYWNRRPRTPVTLNTWNNDYMYIYSLFPEGIELTERTAIETICSTKPDSRKRQSAVRAITALCKFAGMDVNFKHLKGNYRPRDRYIPNDSEIMEAWCQLDGTHWQWLYGMIATFGLRSHAFPQEALYLVSRS